jgi:hypothetical protein
MKKIVVIAVTFVFATSSFAGTNGGLGGAFARMGAGARAKALGNAYVAVAEGPSAIYFNPGALPFAQKREFNATLAHMALDRRLDYIAFAAPVHPKAGPEKRVVNGGVGLGWLHAGVSDIDSRDFDGNPLPMINMSSNLFLFSFGLQPHEKVGVGVTAKVIYETFGIIGNDNRAVDGNGFGVDAGVFAQPIEHLSLGAQLKDLGSKTTWNTSNYWSQGTSKVDDWPLQCRLGAAYQRWGCLGAVDVESSKEGDTRLHAGAEGTYDITDRQSVAGRIGYDDGAATFGVGLGFTVWRLRSTLDFAYVVENIAPDDATTISWGIKF